MSDSDPRSAGRPVLLGLLGQLTEVPAPQGRNNERVRFIGESGRIRRLDGQMERAAASLQNDIVLTDSLQATDPQMVLVFEGVEERTDLSVVARTVGLEVLVEYEDAFESDQEVTLRSDRPTDPMIRSCLHAICLNQAAMDRVMVAWRSWTRDRSVGRGLSALSELFEHLRDVRPWGPVDRLRAVDWGEYFASRVPEARHIVEVELWYRQSPGDRQRAVSETTQLVIDGGGRLLATADQPEIGYLAIKCEVQDSNLRQLASGTLDALKIVKSAHVLFLKVEGQGLLDPADDQQAQPFEAALPTGVARVAILDGVPASNHPRLAGRLDVRDPEDLAGATRATAELRRHGTWMASAVVWGDIAAGDRPLDGPLIVRPVLAPTPESVNGVEEFRESDLIPDVMRRAFRELFEGSDDGLTIVNISLGDPTIPFDAFISSWARMLDQLSWEYGALVVVSAGNHRHIKLQDHDSASLLALSGQERSDAIHTAQAQTWANRRIISPAESINAITVGALHDDATGAEPRGYVFDPHDGLPGVSPVSRFGGGHRRAVKPEVAAPGGRAMYLSPPLPTEMVSASPSTLHGIQVATPSGGEGRIVGTSPAAALISRRLARLVDLAIDVTGEALDRHHRAVAAKALLVHGARHPDWPLTTDFPIGAALGYGPIVRDLSEGCAQNEATLLFVGDLYHRQQRELQVPLPNGLSSRYLKRITATVAWLSPINWRHRQYRRAQLQLAKPVGFTDLPASLDLPDLDASRGSSTVKHQVWEIDRAVAAGVGQTLTAQLKCFGQAGGLDDMPVPFAVALTLWVAPEMGIDVYTQIAQQVKPRVAVIPRTRR